MDGVKDWIYEEEQRKINQVYKDYTTEEKNDFVIKLKKDHKNTIIGWISAGMSDKIPAKILDMVADDIEQAKLDDRDPFKKIILAVHFSKSKALRDEWRKKDGIWDSLSTKFANLNSSYQLDYEEFPLTVSDTK